MATFATSQQWLHESSLLLEARPHTTKITCRYSVKPKPARRVSKTGAAAPTSDDKKKEAAAAAAAAAATSNQQNPRAKLVLKTVDPASGVCLKYKTTKAAEVSRLVQLLGQLGRRQAGLVAASEADDVTMADADTAAAAAAAAAPEPVAPAAAAATAAAAASTPAPPPAAAGGGKGKKKKGKR